MSATQTFRWRGGALQPLELEHADPTAAPIAAAESWLVVDGQILALEVHRQRFLDATAGVDSAPFDSAPADSAAADADAAAFWDAAVAATPRTGDWFPRVELQLLAAAPAFVFRLRSAPTRTRSTRLATIDGPDPRNSPSVIGPDAAALLLARTVAQHSGADDAVILSPDGYVVETTTSALLWWRGEILCAPALEFERVDSVTARTVITLATALGIAIYYEAVTPSELDGVELWSVNALQGIRIVTEWVHGPSMAEKPGRLGTWRGRLDRLRKPMP